MTRQRTRRLINLDQEAAASTIDAPAKPRRRMHVSETPAAPRPRPSLVEQVLDNLGAWTVIAAAVGLLYLVWATLEILSHYVGAVPKIAP